MGEGRKGIQIGKKKLKLSLSADNVIEIYPKKLLEISEFSKAGGYRFKIQKSIVFLCCLHAKLLQSYLTLCNPMDCSPPGSSVHGFSRQEYWSGLPCPPPGYFPDSGIKPASPAVPALAGRIFTAESLGKVSTLSAAAKSLQSCPTLCDPMDCSPPGSSVHGFSRQEHWSGLPFPSLYL